MVSNASGDLPVVGPLPEAQLLTDPAACVAYSYDNSKKTGPVLGVVFPESEQDVVHTVQWCHARSMALISRGAGTGTAGGTVPLKPSWIISFERMKKIIQIDADNRFAIVQPGVTNQALQDAVAEHGFFWPPDPTSKAVCTIGGNLACNAAGPLAVKYGTPRENTLGLKAVTGKGEIFSAGTRTTKGVVGYDLTRLLIGSEGTLGIITEATLKLTPLPEHIVFMRAEFSSVLQAAQTVSAIMAQPAGPRVLEFIDGAALKLVEDYMPGLVKNKCAAMLLIATDGSVRQAQESAAILEQICHQNNALELTIAESEAEVDELWAARKALSPSLRKVAPNKINEDVVVPVSNLPELIETLAEISQRYKIPIVNFGHAGNGNVHVNLLYNPQDPLQKANAEPCLTAVFDKVLALKGTLSGEHGIGFVKKRHISREVDLVSTRIMHAIKKSFDPKNILNPGKAIPELEIDHV
ncbi:MAG: FAD-binding oxidoreductase [bacterium]